MTTVLTRVRLAPVPAGDEIIVSVSGPGWSMRVALTGHPVDAPAGAGAIADEHLLVDEAFGPWRTVADVLVVDTDLPRLDDPSTGWLVAAGAPGRRCVLTTRDGWTAELTPLRETTRGLDRSVLGHYASLVHFWLVSGRPLADLDGAVLSVEGLVHQLGSLSRASISEACGESRAR
jgi:hypothetical protein